MSTITEYEEQAVLEEVIEQDLHDLIVYNDDINTFDHVIETLIKVCKHDSSQAEQCTLIIHYKGKCTVKMGTFIELKPMCQSICDAGIQAAVV